MQQLLFRRTAIRDPSAHSTNRRLPVVIFLAGLLLAACEGQPSPTLMPTPLPSPTSSATFRAIPPTSTATLTPTPTPRPTAIERTPPGHPGVALFGLQDPQATSGLLTGPSIPGDDYAHNVFERPFSIDREMLPDVDLASVKLSMDDTWFYFSIRTAGLRSPTRQLLAAYAIELDTDLDGRGDFLLLTSPPTSQDWAVNGVRLFEDRNDDVGGDHPLQPDEKYEGDGYETLLDDSGEGLDRQSIWARLDPLLPMGIQLAVKQQALDHPAVFLWAAWADAGVQLPEKFDYHDSYPAAQEALALDSRELVSLDSTCRAPYGFAPDGSEPGICPPDWLMATPVPTEAPTITTPTPGPSPTASPTGPTPTPTIAGTRTSTPTGTITPGLASITGTVWSDTNSDSILNPGETGLSGFILLLGSEPCPASGTATQTSAANGTFAFTGLQAGTYCVTLDHVERVNTTPDQVTMNLSAQEHFTVLFGLAP